MSFTLERSTSPARSGISGMFGKSRRDKKSRDSAQNSINSSESGDHALNLRASLEDAIDKLKGDDEEHGIKKLVPKGISRSRRKRQEQEAEQRESEEAERGRTVADRGTLDNDVSPGTLSRNDSGVADGSSLITFDDSETDSPGETPPALTSHPSHMGYLTTSSPLIQSTTLPDPSTLDEHFDRTPRSATFPKQAESLAASTSTPSLAEDTLSLPTNGSDRRSPSPVGRLKQALTPRRQSGSSSTSPERRVTEPEPVLAAPLKIVGTESNRRGSVASRISNFFPDRQVSIEPSSATSSPERPRTGKIHPIGTNSAPSTPPPSENHSAPIIVNTPPTPTESSSPRFPPPKRERTIPEPIVTNTNVVTSPSGNMISHRRVRSGSGTLGPSKLSNIISAPLTPTPENAPITPGGGGFFSSVFSAAQNAANTLSNSIANTSTTNITNRSRSGTQELKEVDSPVVETFAEKEESDNLTEERELAVKTLGMGDLSLSHLGISENSSGANTPVVSKFEETRGRGESIKEDFPMEDTSDAPPATTIAEENLSLVRPRSLYDPVLAGDQTPPNGSVFEGKTGIQRSGSIRSAIGNHRKRGSSAATGTTIGAAIAAANSSLANPNAGTPKITGFAVASKKRNRDFHQLFRSVPDDDYLIEDYSCALQREILAHGRLYVSEGHLCFNSNIFGWVTTLVMSFDEIVSVEKRSTALLFKNGLMISTLHAKNVFASFTSRDSTYDLIVGIWKLGHPSLRSSLNGVRLEETGGGDKTEKDDGISPPAASQSGSESGSEDEDGEIYDEDDADSEISFTQADGSIAGSDVGEKIVSRKPSTAVVMNGALVEKSKTDAAPLAVVDFPGPTSHAPTDCTDESTHYAKVIGDEVIAAPLGKIYNLLFGTSWYKNFLVNDEKCWDFIQEENAKLPLNQENKTRNYSYIKPLNGSIGPSKTKCVCTETLDFMDLEKSISITISTVTPDVPSGNVFSTKTRYCMSWAEGNTTRLQMNCAIEWTGKSWLRGPIEKGASDGQVSHAKNLIAALKTAVSSRRGGTTAAVAGKSRKKGRKSRGSHSLTKLSDGASDTKPSQEDWGLFEPLHGIFGPVVDIIQPLLTGNILYGLLVGLIVASWFRFGFSDKGNRGGDLGAYFGTPERVAAYEEIWRREESELWDWLEDRIGMDRLREVGSMPIEARTIAAKLKDERMVEREMDAAIKVTEEKLRLLKISVEKAKVTVRRDEEAEKKEKASKKEKVADGDKGRET